MDQPPTDTEHYDGLLVLGSSLGELATNKWNPMLVPDGPFVQVDADQRVIGRSFYVSHGVVGEIGSFLQELCALADEFPPDAVAVADRRDQIARIKAEKPPITAIDQYNSEAAPIEPAALVRVLNETLPADALVFLDAGNCVDWALHYLVAVPPREVHNSLSMGPMGFAVAAVVGAKMGRPDRACLALVGDGAFLMHGAEVSTARKNGVGAVWVVLNDEDFHMVSQGKEFFYHADDKLPFNKLYRLGQPDLSQFAAGLGAETYVVNTPAELRDVLPRAFRRADEANLPQVVIAQINQASCPPYYLSDYAPTKPASPTPAQPHAQPQSPIHAQIVKGVR